MPRSKSKDGLLTGARVYLSGPMDFVASRTAEKQFGWRNRVSQFLQTMGTTVFDPWFKPDVRGLHEYGREDVKTGERIRAACGKAVPGIIITGDTAPDRLREAQASGYHLMHKPVRPPKLRALLSYLVA